MGGKLLGKKRGLKRPNKTATRHSKKPRRAEQERTAYSPSRSSSGMSYPCFLDLFERKQSEEENVNVAPPTEEIIHKETSTYDELLKLLSSSSKSVAHANKLRRRQEEGKSDTEEDDDEDEDDGDESSGLPEEVDDDAEGSA
ncbi:hypothetical protein PanWU01x14_111780 [Parasponia andersonii]|uniref:Uncharacterized protein n=1 Tax=Parasponia andersonii TaxID=3476 RepID=A0A2P5CYN1_PARAD|nr:hypothetical protein PanWU01x14_111780 [Parasponia andersonii]